MAIATLPEDQFASWQSRIDLAEQDALDPDWWQREIDEARREADAVRRAVGQRTDGAAA